MRCEIYTDINRFAEDVLEVVKAYETENNLLLGNINRELRGGKPNDLKWAVKSDEGQVILVGAQVNPYNLTIAEKENKGYEGAIELVVKTLQEQQLEIPGVIAVEDLAYRFADTYMKYFNKKTELKMGLNLLKAYEITSPTKATGKVRLATEEDLFYLPYWEKAFAEECGLFVDPVETSYNRIKPNIEKDVIYIWEDRVPVSVAIQGRSGDKGAGISFVYTPPYYRGKGYAASCVAYVSQQILAKGFEHCYLYADENNPISNKIYTGIGYEMMGRTLEICFID